MQKSSTTDRCAQNRQVCYNIMHIKLFNIVAILKYVTMCHRALFIVISKHNPSILKFMMMYLCKLLSFIINRITFINSLKHNHRLHTGQIFSEHQQLQENYLKFENIDIWYNKLIGIDFQQCGGQCLLIKQPQI